MHCRYGTLPIRPRPPARMSARLLISFRSSVRTAPRGIRPLCDWHGWPDLAQEIGIERCSLEVMLNRFLPTSLTIRYVVSKGSCFPMAGRFGVIGCGYVGSAAARHFGLMGLEVTGTTTSPSRLQELCGIVDHPRIYRLEIPVLMQVF